MKSTYISYWVADFKTTKNPMSLLRACYLIVKQKRCNEMLFGLYCQILHRPGKVIPAPEAHQVLSEILAEAKRTLLCGPWNYNRSHLMELFGRDYAIKDLPQDFVCARSESIICEPGRLILGEYGEDLKRIFLITANACIQLDHYQSDPDVTHIHAMHKAHGSEKVLVSTGDTAKYLDLWQLEDRGLKFITTLKHRLAGYTAMAQVRDTYYLGSDFTSRPNFIERLGDGRRFFFPGLVHGMFVGAFQSHRDRYIVSLHKNIEVIGQGWALSIFDTQSECFRYCDFAQPMSQAEKAHRILALPPRAVPT